MLLPIPGQTGGTRRAPYLPGFPQIRAAAFSLWAEGSTKITKVPLITFNYVYLFFSDRTAEKKFHAEEPVVPFQHRNKTS
jgi:hypothetical protein